MTMKSIFNRCGRGASALLGSLATALLLCAPTPAPAATYYDGYNIGYQGDDAFSGAGAPLGVTGSVNSNSVYYITSPRGSGAPRITSVLAKTELTAGTLKFYISTNVLTCASNQPANTNIIWLTSTNSTLATNDLLVLHNAASDGLSLLVLSGNAADAGGLVYTNAAGYNGVKVFTGSTNAIVAGDKLYKMTSLVSITPLAEYRMTNGIISPWGGWLQLNDLNGGTGAPLGLVGRAGWPTATVLTYSNAGSMFISGDYYRRPRF